MRKYAVLGVVTACFIFVQATIIYDPSDKAGLGKLLFFDPILSKDSTVSCASCHRPQFAFSDTSAVSSGVGGIKGTRNTPSAMNVRLQQAFFWDGRAKTLEEQALAPIANPDEMNLPLEEALKRLKKSEHYQKSFRQVFNSEPTLANLAQALAAFERTLETSDSPFDEWKFTDDSTVVSAAVKRGFALFNGKGQCVECHFGADFTTNEFRNIGLFNGKDLNDSGRYMVTKNKADIGKFKVGSLRNVAVTGPYMHNGMLKTLKEVIEFYNHPAAMVADAVNTDSLLQKPLNLTEGEKSDLEAFLVALTDKQFHAVAKTAKR